MAAAAQTAVPKTGNQWKSIVKTAGAGFCGGILIWGLGDVVGEFTTFIKLREKGIALANEHQELKDQIGHPFTAGPWYNAKIGFTAGGNMAQINFQLQGTKQITDVNVRGVRGGGVVNRALYNLIGSGNWTVVDCTAMFPSGGGLVQPKSLLPKTSADAARTFGREQESAIRSTEEGKSSASSQMQTPQGQECVACQQPTPQQSSSGPEPAAAGVADGDADRKTRQSIPGQPNEKSNTSVPGSGSGSNGRTWWQWVRGSKSP